MRILIVDYDPWTVAGGAQTYYARLIERNPEHTFHFLTSAQAVPVPYPSNAVALACGGAGGSSPFYPGHFDSTVDDAMAREAFRVAAAAAGQTYDVVDVPSFRPICQYLRPALAMRGVQAGRIVLGLHGWSSVGFALDYEAAAMAQNAAAWEKCERDAFEAADVRYALSRRHIGECKVLGDLPVAYLDPKHLFEPTPPRDASAGSLGTAPDLWCIGRLERLKGPDAFLRLIGSLSRACYGTARLAGPDGWPVGASENWRTHLDRLAAKLGVSYAYEGSLPREELIRRCYLGRSVVVVTSRNDTLNLVAVEALFRGCPVVLSQQTGIHEYLRERLPHLPFVSIDPDRPGDAVPQVLDLLRDFDGYRQRLRDALERNPPPAPVHGFISDTYCEAAQRDEATIAAAASRYQRALEPPLVTILTPTYNRARYIRETLRSVQAQTYPRIEHLVLNDGSTDDTEAAIAEFGERVTLHSHPNMGEARTVNRGFSLAKGELIGVVNDEDPIDPDLVTQVVESYRKNPDCLVFYPDWRIIDGDGRVLNEVRVADYNYGRMIAWHYCMPGPGTFFHRRGLELAGGRDTAFRYVGDFDFWLRLGLHGPFRRVPAVLASWRHHADAATLAGNAVAMAEEHLLTVNQLFARGDLPPAVRRLKRKAIASAYYIAGLECREKAPAAARRYFLRALLKDPLYLAHLPDNFAETPGMVRQVFVTGGWPRRAITGILWTMLYGTSRVYRMNRLGLRQTAKQLLLLIPPVRRYVERHRETVSRLLEAEAKTERLQLERDELRINLNMLLAEWDAAIRNPDIEWLARIDAEQRVSQLIVPTDTVIDIGPGTRPMSYFRPAEHICVEPYHEYVEVLATMQVERPEIRIIEATALPAVQAMEDRSVESVFLLDVIEHIAKNEGTKLVAECERIAKRQVVIFTPFGFMPQEYEQGETDAWGMHGTEFQTHRSGWTPMDFGSGWHFVACKDFHSIDSKNRPLEVPFGAFWAIKTLP